MNRLKEHFKMLPTPCIAGDAYARRRVLLRRAKNAPWCLARLYTGSTRARASPKRIGATVPFRRHVGQTGSRLDNETRRAGVLLGQDGSVGRTTSAPASCSVTVGLEHSIGTATRFVVFRVPAKIPTTDLGHQQVLHQMIDESRP